MMHSPLHLFIIESRKIGWLNFLHGLNKLQCFPLMGSAICEGVECEDDLTGFVNYKSLPAGYKKELRFYAEHF